MIIYDHKDTHYSLSHMLQQDSGPNQGQEGVVDPVLDFKLDLDDDMVKLAWESTQVLSI